MTASAGSPALSVVILTLNEEANLPACLASLAVLHCEVFVVDSGSTDRTVAIAREHGAAVVTHPFVNYSDQRNWAMRNLPFRAGWLLHLDADESLTPELAKEIRALRLSAPSGVDGYMFPRRTMFLGRWIRHGGHYPVYHLRLFRNGKGRCEDRLYDQHFTVDGAVSRLRHDFVDVVASSLREWTTRHARWAELEAAQMSGEDHSEIKEDLFGHPIERRRWLRNRFYGKLPAFVRPFGYWVYRYFLRLGFLDGRQGLIFHFLQGFWFRFLVDATILEKRWLSRNGTGPLDSAASGLFIHKES